MEKNGKIAHLQEKERQSRVNRSHRSQDEVKHLKWKNKDMQEKLIESVTALQTLSDQNKSLQKQILATEKFAQKQDESEKQVSDEWQMSYLFEENTKLKQQLTKTAQEAVFLANEKKQQEMLKEAQILHYQQQIAALKSNENSTFSMESIGDSQKEKANIAEVLIEAKDKARDILDEAYQELHQVKMQAKQSKKQLEDMQKEANQFFSDLQERLKSQSTDS